MSRACAAAVLRLAHVEDVGDAHGLQQLAARGVVVAAQVQEPGQDLRGERTRLRRQYPLLRLHQPVPADLARLPAFVLQREPTLPRLSSDV